MTSSTFLRDSGSQTKGLAALAVASLVAIVSPSASYAANCGDDVAGQRVACACGDTVVSDTVLWATDPVASQPCSGDGLTIVVPSGSDGITLNLGGQSLLGNGRGSGIRVVHGGNGGSTIIGGDADDSRAEIARFDTGIRASGHDVLREVRAIDIHDNTDDGMKIHASGVHIEDVRSSVNGRDGVALMGHGVSVSGVVASENAQDGLKLRGAGANVSAETTGNGANGTVIGGRGNVVHEIRTESNGGAGLKATGDGHEVGRFASSGNAGGDVAGREGAAR